MANSSIGILSVFNHETHEWFLYKGRLEQWFLANDIDGTVDKSGFKRRAILLSSFAENTFRLIRDLALPKDVANLSYEEVITLLDNHFQTRKCGFAERHKFFSAVQEPGESFAQWAARVRGLAMYCGFATAALEDSLRDRFVLVMCGGPERDRILVNLWRTLRWERHCGSLKVYGAPVKGHEPRLLWWHRPLAHSAVFWALLVATATFEVYDEPPGDVNYWEEYNPKPQQVDQEEASDRTHILFQRLVKILQKQQEPKPSYYRPQWNSIEKIPEDSKWPRNEKRNPRPPRRSNLMLRLQRVYNANKDKHLRRNPQVCMFKLCPSGYSK